MNLGKGFRYWWVLVLAVSSGAHAQGVEMLAENEMGGVNVFAGDVLNILGAPAAGEVLPDLDADATPPPIRRTAGEESAISMGVVLAERELFVRPRDLPVEADAVTLVSPAQPVPITIERNVASPGVTDGGASFRILPGERNIAASIEAQPGDAPDGLRTTHSTRIDEVRVSDVTFPQGGVGLEGQTIVISGLVIEVDALITER